MRQKSSLEQEYKNLMNQTSPDLWSRIERNLKEHPERALGQEAETGDKAEEVIPGRISRTSRLASYPWRTLGTAAAAATVFLVVMASPWRPSLFPAEKNAVIGTAPSEGGDAAAGDVYDTAAAVETIAETAVAAGEPTAAETAAAAGEPTAIETAAMEPKAADSAEGAASEPAAVREPAAAAPPPAYAELPPEINKNAASEARASAGILRYSQLNLASYHSLALPDQAVTLAEDTMYFSEDILEDTDLLCLGTVTSVSLEIEDVQEVSFLVYEICLDDICYSADYITETEYITVKSPVVGAGGGENQILYQLQEGASYLLPLKGEEENWELLFPFAPQIQVTGKGGYLFHSGYSSLTDARTLVVIGEQEGANDFYYDRMLLREDEDFLSDYISLVMKYTGGEL